MSDDASKKSPSAGRPETAAVKDVDGEPDYQDLGNEDLLELVADLDEDRYPIASRARKALSQLEDSSA